MLVWLIILFCIFSVRSKTRRMEAPARNRALSKFHLSIEPPLFTSCKISNQTDGIIPSRHPVPAHRCRRGLAPGLVLGLLQTSSNRSPRKIRPFFGTRSCRQPVYQGNLSLSENHHVGRHASVYWPTGFKRYSFFPELLNVNFWTDFFNIWNNIFFSFQNFTLESMWNLWSGTIIPERILVFLQVRKMKNLFGVENNFKKF